MFTFSLTHLVQYCSHCLFRLCPQPLSQYKPWEQHSGLDIGFTFQGVSKITQKMLSQNDISPGEKRVVKKNCLLLVQDGEVGV